MTIIPCDEIYVDKLEDLFHKFWNDTTFAANPDGSVTIDRSDYETLVSLCLEIERGS